MHPSSSIRANPWPWRCGVWAVLALAAGLRWAMYAQLASSGQGALLQLHRWDQSDMHFYDRWARIIASGDVLTDRPLHPLHDWHLAVAEAYFTAHPDKSPPGAGRPLDPVIAQKAWDDWYGGKRFHQHPLYPYLVALIYAAMSPDVRWVFLGQMVLGVASTWLVMRIGRRHFGPAPGLIAGALVALAGPVVFYECVLLRGPLVTFLGLAVVDLAGGASDTGPQAGGGLWRWLASGGLGGLAILAQSGMAVLVGAVAVVALADGLRRHGLRVRAVGNALAVVLAATVTLLPAVGRNLWVGVPPWQWSSVGQVTFIATNGPLQHADLSFVATRTIPEVLEAAQAGGPGVIRRTLELHPSLGSYLALLARKLAITWHWLEKPNNVGFAYFAEHAWVLKAMPVRFAVVAPLAVAGLLVAWPRARRPVMALLPLLVLVGLGVLSCVIAAPHARYRAPLVMWLAPLAGLGAVVMTGWCRELFGRRSDTAIPAGTEARRSDSSVPVPGPGSDRSAGDAAPSTRRTAGGWAAAGVVGVLGLFALTLRPLPDGVQPIVVADWLAPYRAWWLPESESRAAAGDWAGAAAVLEASFRVRPPVLERLSRQTPATTADDADLARFYAAIYARYGQALRAMGQTQRALAAERRSMDLVEAAAGFEVNQRPDRRIGP